MDEWVMNGEKEEGRVVVKYMGLGEDAKQEGMVAKIDGWKQEKGVKEGMSVEGSEDGDGLQRTGRWRVACHYKKREENETRNI